MFAELLQILQNLCNVCRTFGTFRTFAIFEELLQKLCRNFVTFAELLQNFATFEDIFAELLKLWESLEFMLNKSWLSIDQSVEKCIKSIKLYKIWENHRKKSTLRAFA